MSGSGLWFSRFASGGEGWLPLVAFGSTVCVFVAMGAAPETAAPDVTVTSLQDEVVAASTSRAMDQKTANLKPNTAD
jgi:hypothetical protein